MTMPPSMQFASKVDAWLAVLMLGGGVLALLAVAPAIGGSFARSAGAAQLLGVAAVLLLSLLLPAWLLLGTRYSLTDDALKVRAGPFRWTVPLAEISSVRPSRSILSAPALSLDRIQIEYNAVRLHSAIGYVTPDDEHQGRGEGIRAARRKGLHDAAQRRLAHHRQRRNNQIHNHRPDPPGVD